jgi:hypothetical protein
MYYINLYISFVNHLHCMDIFTCRINFDVIRDNSEVLTDAKERSETRGVEMGPSSV